MPVDLVLLIPLLYSQFRCVSFPTMSIGVKSEIHGENLRQQNLRLALIMPLMNLSKLVRIRWSHD